MKSTVESICEISIKMKKGKRVFGIAIFQEVVLIYVKKIKPLVKNV